MAEFLLKRGSNPSTGGFKDGDIVEVKEDGANWSASELERVVALPGMTLAEARKYQDEDFILTIGLHENPGGDINGPMEIRLEDGTVVATVRKNAFPLVLKTRGSNFEAIQDIAGLFDKNGISLRITVEKNVFAKRRYRMVGTVIEDKLA